MAQYNHSNEPTSAIASALTNKKGEPCGSPRYRNFSLHKIMHPAQR